MNTSVYQLTNTLPVTSHYPNWNSQFLRDGKDHDIKRVDVHVSSGDYFITLATMLDGLDMQVSTADDEALQRIIADLLYLHYNYKIVKK
ncbi:MAG: hypothetical protein JWL85_955 [Candidatus Saccharibacteria bacterium]|nr:hypothetical protein [Candidatus Saccharibacteria bacterium]